MAKTKESGLNRYRVKEGQHHEAGRVYSKGDVVQSPHDLAKAFPNKFKVLSGPKPPRTQVLNEETEEQNEDVAKRPRAAVIGTDLESEDSQNEDGDDSDKLDPVEGEDSDTSDSADDDSDSESAESDEPHRKKKKKKKHQH